jgi:hypothetical protein
MNQFNGWCRGWQVKPLCFCNTFWEYLEEAVSRDENGAESGGVRETLAGMFSLYRSSSFLKILCGLEGVGNGISSVNLKPAAYLKKCGCRICYKVKIYGTGTLQVTDT